MFLCKTSVLGGLGGLFGTFFVIFLFFFHFSCKTSVFCEAGWSFWVKKTYIFMKIFSFCAAGWSFWYLFCYFFVLLFKLNRIILKKGDSSFNIKIRLLLWIKSFRRFICIPISYKKVNIFG